MTSPGVATRNAIRRLGTVVILLAGTALAISCDGGKPSTEAVLLGRVVFVPTIPSGGAIVEVLDEDGSAIELAEPCATDNGGAFAAHLSELPKGRFFVRATTSDVPLSAEIEQFDAARVVQVNLITTLRHLFHQLHPDLTVEDVRQKINAHLGIPDRFGQGDELVNPYYSRFSPEIWYERASGHAEGASGLLGEHMTALENGGHMVFDPIAWQLYLEEEEKELAALEQVERPSVKVSEEVAKDFESFEFGLGEVIDVAGWVFDRISGCFDNADKQFVDDALTDIETDLGLISTQLANLATEMKNLFTQAAYGQAAATVAGDVNNVLNAFSQLQRIHTFASYNPSPDVDSLHDAIQTMYKTSSYQVQGLLDNAQNIHRAEYIGTPSAQLDSMVDLIRQYLYANLMISASNADTMRSQILTYWSYQANVIQLLASAVQPGMIFNSENPKTFTYNFPATPAGQLKNASANINAIAGNMQQEMAYLPLPPVDPMMIVDSQTPRVFQVNSHSTGDSQTGNNVTYARNLVSGGLAGWQLIDTSNAQYLFRTITWPRLQAIGFKFQPGPVTYDYYDTCNQWGRTYTATSSGFVTVDVSSTQINVGWADTNGNTGFIGCCNLDGGKACYKTRCKSGDLAVLLNSPNGDTTFNTNKSNCNYSSAPYGPVILMSWPTAGNFKPSAGSAVVAATSAFIGLYQGLTVQLDPESQFTPDPGSNSASGTQRLIAFPDPGDGGVPYASEYEVTGDVFWQALDPSDPSGQTPSHLATISNVPQPPPTDGGVEPPTPVDGGYVPQPFDHKIGAIHWLKGSGGKQVLFKASRYLPNGTQAVGTLTITSPASATATPDPDAIDIFPSGFNTSYMNLKTGVQLYVTRHFGDGTFVDVTDSTAFPTVSYTVSPPDETIVVNHDGFVQSTVDSGTPKTIKIIVTDTAVTGAGSRPTDVCTISLE